MFLLTEPNDDDTQEIIIEPVKDTKPRCPLCGGDLVVPCLIEGAGAFAITHRGIDLNRPYYFQTGTVMHFGEALCESCGHEMPLEIVVDSISANVEVKQFQAPDEET